MAKWAFLQEPPSPVRKNQLVARWLMLLSLCMGLFGSYYVYDIPAATENNLATWFGEGVSNSTAVGDDDGGSASEDSFPFRFNLLYSVYSFPNCVLPFFGGLVSDKLGVRLTGVIFMGLIMLGQIITAVGCTISNADTAWYVMWLGRTVFGLGGESLSVAQSAFVGAWDGLSCVVPLARGSVQRDGRGREWLRVRQRRDRGCCVLAGIARTPS